MMWAAIFCLIFMAVSATVTLFCLDRLAKISQTEVSSHDRCHEQQQSMLQMSTVRAEAQALRRAAQMWDSVEEAHAKKVLAREKYVDGGPSLVAIWLREQATQLDGKRHD